MKTYYVYIAKGDEDPGLKHTGMTYVGSVRPCQDEQYILSRDILLIRQ